MLNKFNIYKGLPKTIYIVFIVQIINRFGDFVMPFMTLFLIKKLNMPLSMVGIIVMVTSLITIPGSMLGGTFADKLGRKKTYIFAQTASALFLVPCAFLGTSYIIVAFLMISTFFNGAVRPALHAIIADVLPPEKRQAGYSLQYLGINIGVAIGPIVAGFLFNNFLPMLFIGDSLTSFIALGLAYIYIKETKPNLIKGENNPKEKLKKDNIVQILLGKPEILVFLAIYIIFTVVSTQSTFALPLMIDKVFAIDGAEKYGFLMSVNAITVIFLTVFITRLTRRIHSLINILVAIMLYGIGLGMIGIIKSYTLFVISTVIWTIGEILIVTNFGVYLANKSPSDYRARFSAIGSLSWATGASVGTSLGGKYIQKQGIVEVWPLAFVLCSFSAFLMFLLYLHSTKTEKVKAES
ncbi:MDR family MFS transporter [Clostridium sp. 'White wine YQ']|uniref:MDR family MFS transporter n=1 Tax=Clostridium sp. 'White wine YQ' TaxID=3027474 RepID=UPI002366ED96|nr:MFS transporter [Clostridium sp. 'White wine YQ']MDD7795707.1 MFS transporter [Clostridium sp. 'White wine YQ']